MIWIVAEGRGSSSDRSPFGMLVYNLTPWTLPFCILAVGTIATFVVVGRTWERMGRTEKLLSIVPAVAPLGAFRFMFVVIAFFITAVVILAGVAFILSMGSSHTDIFGMPRPRTSGANTMPPFGSWWGDDRVQSGRDGRPTHIGDDKVTYGPNGQPILVGNREVMYGSDGKPAWIGEDRVQYGRDGSIAWIGNRRVRP